MRLGPGLLAALLLGTAGCATRTDSTFSPIELRLEPTSGGAQFLVLRNNSGQELRNYELSVHLWSEHSLRLRWRESPFERCDASGASWPPGKALRFRAFRKGMENPITEPISRVEVVGHCDMGRFHQVWLGDDSGQLRATKNR